MLGLPHLVTQEEAKKFGNALKSCATAWLLGGDGSTPHSTLHAPLLKPLPCLSLSLSLRVSLSLSLSFKIFVLESFTMILNAVCSKKHRFLRRRREESTEPRRSTRDRNVSFHVVSSRCDVSIGLRPNSDGLQPQELALRGLSEGWEWGVPTTLSPPGPIDPGILAIDKRSVFQVLWTNTSNR